MKKKIKDTTNEERCYICIDNTPVECRDCPLYVDETRCCRDSLENVPDQILEKEVDVEE